MPFTQKQYNTIKNLLFVAALVFALQINFPHMALAAETVAAASQPLSPEDQYARVIEREEKIHESLSGAISYLPLAGEPGVIAEHWLTVTAYSSTPDQTDDTPFTTAWQTPVRDGVVALNFLPKGTFVKFPDMFGDKVFIVEDRMNVRYKFRADIWMYERSEAKQFGLKYLRMQVLDARADRAYVLKNFEPAFPGKR